MTRKQMTFRDITDLIGNTPMIRLTALVPEGSAEVLAKMEMFNPGGSVKDRIGLHIIRKAEESGQLKPGGVIIEATSGNTGIGLALVAAARGYRLILVMPETMSQERRAILEAYGAELILTPGPQGMRGSVERVEELVKENPDYYMPQQFSNPANPEAHRLTTAVEILEQTEGKIDAFIAGIGTGGTISGVGQVLKEKVPGVEVIGVEPDESPVLSGGAPGPHRIQGIGAGFVPETLDMSVVDRIMRVKDIDAFLTARALSRQEGILTGLSAGAAVFAAVSVAKELGRGKRVVTLLPDTGERYLSMGPYFRMDLQRLGIEV